MFILNEEIKEQERQAIRELYPKFPDTQVIVTKVPLKPFYKAHRIQFVAMAHVTKILAKYGYLEVSDYHNIPGLMEFLIDQICEEYDLHLRIDRKDLVLDTMRKLDPYKGNIREIKSYLTKKLIELESTQRSTLTGIELMKSFKL